jgi:hypothetical protein
MFDDVSAASSPLAGRARRGGTRQVGTRQVDAGELIASKFA